MGAENVPLIAFNRGYISKLALARTDIKRTAMSAEEQSNWIPRVLGSMMLRPGFKYISPTLSNAKAFNIPFIFSNTDFASLELTNTLMRVRVDDDIVSRVSVGTAVIDGDFGDFVTNGGFDSATGWTTPAGWAISGGKANATTASSALSQTAAETLVNGKSYSITYTVTRSAGTVTPTIGGTSGTARSSSATFTETIVAGATQIIGFTGAGFIGTIDVVSITSIDSGWVDADDVGATSTITGGKLDLVGTRFAAAIRKQEVAVSGGDINKEHALRVIVDRGPVTIRVGSTDGADDYVAEASLGTGTHSLAFTPTGNFWIKISSLAQATKIVDSVQIEAAGDMTLPTPWLTADLPFVRFDQSADVVYVAVTGYQQYKIERHNADSRSWSVVLYEPEDGPFRVLNISTTTLTPSAISGDITLTSSRAIFKSTNVGSLFKIDSVGQRAEIDVNGANQWSDPVRVTGISGSRGITVVVAGTWAGTVTLQRSAGEPGSWVDVATYTNGTYPSEDGLENQIIYYRVGMDTGDYISGTAELSIEVTNGSITGIARITGYTSETVVSAAVLKQLGATAASANWYEGEWSPRRGYPSAVVLDGGRLAWGGKSKLQDSVSDAYESFDDSVEGDSAPINRTIGSGPVDNINWLLSLTRLLVGTAGAEWSIRSSSLDEPLTNTNFNPKSPSTQGSAAVAAVKLDGRGLFVQKSGTKLYQLELTDQVYGDYASKNLSELTPELCASGILRLGVQRQPDTRVHCVLADGTVAILISQPAEEVLCWVLMETDGIIEDVFILPGGVEDDVYYVVKRTINSLTKRYVEKWAMESECQGGALNKQADSFIIYDDVATATITGLSHLEGEEVVVWADGKDMGGDARATFTVTGGQITLPEAVSQACIGLYYEARFKSAKLAFAAQMGTALTMKKRICSIGLMLANTHYQGLRYGPDFDTDVDGEYLNLTDLPLVENEAVTAANTVWEDLDTDKITFDGEWDTDSRICLLAQAPRPCTAQGAVLGMVTSG